MFLWCGSRLGGRVLAGRRILTGGHIFARTRICFGPRTRRAQSWLRRSAFRADGSIASGRRRVACGNGVRKISRARSRGNRRTTVVAGGAQFWIAPCGLHMLALR
jgi:hypothetical protein